MLHFFRKEDSDLLDKYMRTVFKEMETLQDEGLVLNGAHTRIDWYDTVNLIIIIIIIMIIMMIIITIYCSMSTE